MQEETPIVRQCSELTQLRLFCSGMIFDSSTSLLKQELHKETLPYGLWVSMHAPHSKTQLSLLQYSISLLQQEEYLLLEQKYAKIGLWGNFVRWVQSFQSYHVPELFPSKWMLVDFCDAILARMPQSVCVQVFTFK